MDVRLALVSVLAAVPLSGCVSVWNCNPDQEQFELDELVTAAELDEIVAAYTGDGSWDDISCESVCMSVYQRVRGWETGSISSCELSLPENPDGSGEPGRVLCGGTGYEYFCEGRRPLGHVEAGDRACADALGRSLAALAYLEAASIVAFEQLAEQLAEFGAPLELRARCRAAADDERDHARWLTRLAERRGARVPVVREQPAVADLRAIALHNAVEGCVHETFAALLAELRARRAGSPTLRRVFARIAADEARHAQLAWDLDAWLRSQLDAQARAELDAARRAALERLPERARELASALPAQLHPLTAGDGEALAESLAARLAA